MRELSEGYDLKQAFNDILALAYTVREINTALSEWTEFMNTEMLRDMARNHKDRRSQAYFKKHLTDSFKGIYDKFEDVYGKFNTYFEKKKGKDKV